MARRMLVLAGTSLLVIGCFAPVPGHGARPACQPSAATAGVTPIESGELVNLRGHDAAALVVIGGTVRQRDGAVVLEAYEKGYSPFFGLASAEGDPLDGMDEWLGRKVSVRGCYTSGDVRRPRVRGAVGMLHVEQIGPMPSAVP